MNLQDLVDRAEITDNLLTYAHAVDRQDFDLARRCYHPDAVDDHGRYHGGVDGLIDFFRTLGPTLRRTTHHLGPPLIHLDGDQARVETYCLYRREMQDSAPHEAVLQGLRYLDRFERRDGEWAVAHRRVVLDWEQSGGTAPAVPSGPTWSRGGYGVDDPSHELFTPTASPDGTTPHADVTP